MEVMKKIVFINKNLWSFYNFRYQLASNLSKRYHVYCLYGGSNFHHQKKNKGIKYINIGLSQKPIDIFEDLKYVLKLTFFLKRTKPAIVHCFNPKPVLLSFFSLFFFKKIRLFLTITGLGHSYLTKNKILKFIFNLMYYLSFLRANLIFFQNKSDLSLFKKKGYLKNKKFYHSIGLGMKIDKNLKIKKIKKRIYFAFVSRITKEKGIFEYLYAIKKFRNKTKEQIKFYIVKNFDKNSPVGLDFNKLKNLISKLKINITFLNYSNNIKSLFNKFDILVFPSYREGASKTLMEACNYGKVILTSDVAGCNNIVENNKNGYLFRSHSSNEITRSFEKVIKNKRKLFQMSKYSKKIALRKFDENIILDKIEKFYK